VIEVDVVDHGAQVIAPDDASMRARRFILDRNRFVASTEEMAPIAALGIEASGVGKPSRDSGN
jgi:hypothetical protein